MSSALALNKGPAGSCHPHRLATALARLALASATSTFSLFSWTPVNSFAGHDGVWEVDCGDRGLVRARDVILCSNGHTRTLFPEDWERGVGIASQ
jgi:glycine/D-amino acid oxidase-like deaminating enzyme